MRCALVVGFALACAGPATARALQPAGAPPPPGARYEGHAFDFTTVAPGVWFATGTGAVSAESNSAVIELGDGLLVVDAQTSPAAAWALLRELPRVSLKPVRWLVVTHPHYDHAHGTQAFPPGTTVIGTPYTRAMIAAGKSVDHPTALGNRNFAGTQVTVATAALDTASTPAVRGALERQRGVWTAYLASLATLTPVAPHLTVASHLVLHGGGREVQVRFPGRAHTDGDLVVWLPAERVLVTGDLLQPTLPYMGDGYLNDWADVLDSLRGLKPAVVLPGHGAAFRDVAVLDRQRDYFRAVWSQVAALRAQGKTVAEASAALDLTRFDAAYPRPPGWTDAIVLRQRLRMVQRVYTLLEPSVP